MSVLNKKAPQLGPVKSGTLIASSADVIVSAYQAAFDMHVVSDIRISENLALAWERPGLAGHRMVTLGAALADASTHWLRVIEVPDAVAPLPFHKSGWMSLEVSVADVHLLAAKLQDSAFDILGNPHPLSVSDDIWAMQVAGPAGEVLYLTEVRAPVPAFDLPLGAKALAERLFIPVLSTPVRDSALSFYESLSGNSGLRFDSRVSALNLALEVDPEASRPVATLQLAGSCLIEIDEVPEHAQPSFSVDGLPSGIAFITTVASSAVQLPLGCSWNFLEDATSGATHVAMIQGSSGEWMELVKALPL